MTAPRSPQPAQLADALAQLSAGRFADAQRIAEQIVAADPNDARALHVAGAAAAQLGRTDEAENAAGVVLSNYPTLTVERYLRNFHWKAAADIAHFRDGLVKAGIPFSKLTLVESSPKLAADS